MRSCIPQGANLIPPSAQLVFKGNIFDTYQWEQKLFDGSTATFEMLKRPDTVQILALLDDRIIVQKEQQPNRPFFYSWPGGRHDVESETELDAAKRELLEETGYTFKNWKLVSVAQPHTKIEWFIYTFVASDVINHQESRLDAGEKIETNRLTLSELRQLIVTEPTQAQHLNLDIIKNISNLSQLALMTDLLN